MVFCSVVPLPVLKLVDRALSVFAPLVAAGAAPNLNCGLFEFDAAASFAALATLSVAVLDKVAIFATGLVVSGILKAPALKGLALGGALLPSLSFVNGPPPNLKPSLDDDDVVAGLANLNPPSAGASEEDLAVLSTDCSNLNGVALTSDDFDSDDTVGAPNLKVPPTDIVDLNGAPEVMLPLLLWFVVEGTPNLKVPSDEVVAEELPNL